jgi:hypothetical protein
VHRRVREKSIHKAKGKEEDNNKANEGHVLVDSGDAKAWKAAWINSLHCAGWMRQQFTNTLRTAFLA